MKKASADLHFALCPNCDRAVPRASGEHFCPNEGARYVTACPACESPIFSPHARFCVRCGSSLTHKRDEHAEKGG